MPDNILSVRRMSEAWDAIDLETVHSLLDPEVRWVNPDYAVEPGTRHGHDGRIMELRWFHDAAEAEEAARDGAA